MITWTTLSLNPDDHMKWIYDSRHPDYNTIGRQLREARADALSKAPSWMFELAFTNDAMKTPAKREG